MSLRSILSIKTNINDKVCTMCSAFHLNGFKAFGLCKAWISSCFLINLSCSIRFPGQTRATQKQHLAQSATQSKFYSYYWAVRKFHWPLFGEATWNSDETSRNMHFAWFSDNAMQCNGMQCNGMRWNAMQSNKCAGSESLNIN